jgi:transcriptional regulator with XRE-family HTH domain
MSRVKEVREARGLRQEELAARAGISFSYVRQLEAADRPTPGLDIARRIADALETTIDALFPPGPDDDPAAASAPDPSKAIA